MTRLRRPGQEYNEECEREEEQSVDDVKVQLHPEVPGVAALLLAPAPDAAHGRPGGRVLGGQVGLQPGFDQSLAVAVAAAHRDALFSVIVSLLKLTQHVFKIFAQDT